MKLLLFIAFAYIMSVLSVTIQVSCHKDTKTLRLYNYFYFPPSLPAGR